MISCKVNYKNFHGAFKSGQRMALVVKLINDKTKKIKRISLRLEGSSKVRKKFIEQTSATKFKLSVPFWSSDWSSGFLLLQLQKVLL